MDGLDQDELFTVCLDADAPPSPEGRAAQGLRPGLKPHAQASMACSRSVPLAFVVGVTRRCARRSWRDPTGESPVRVRHSEPPGNECCGRCGNAGSEAYTVIAWGVGLSHEMTTLWRPRPSSEPKATCVAPRSRGAIAPPGSEATSRAKGSCRNLGDPAASAGMVTGGGSQRGITGADCTAAGSRTGP